MLKCNKYLLFPQIFLNNVLHNLCTGVVLTVVHHQVMLEIVQPALCLHVINGGSEDPASNNNNKILKQ